MYTLWSNSIAVEKIRCLQAIDDAFNPNTVVPIEHVVIPPVEGHLSRPVATGLTEQEAATALAEMSRAGSAASLATLRETAAGVAARLRQTGDRKMIIAVFWITEDGMGPTAALAAGQAATG